MAPPIAARKPSFVTLGAYLLCAILLVALVTNPGVLVDAYVHDLAGFTFDAIARSAAGQVPHNDFYSPVGQAFYWPLAAVSAVVAPQVKTVLYANALVALIALAFAALLLGRRLRPLLFAVALLLIVTTAITPREIGGPPWIFDHLALYNRWGWALLIIPAIAVFAPPATPATGASAGRWRIADGVMIGVLIAILFLLKITYFAAAAALVALALMLRTFPLRSAIVAGVVFVLLIVLVELRFHNLGNYLRDLKMAADVGSADPTARRRKLLEHLVVGGFAGLILAGPLWTLRAERSPIKAVVFWWRELLIGGAIIAMGALAATQNFARFECPLFAAAIVVVLELALRRAARPDFPASSSGNRLSRLADALAIIVALSTPVVDAASIGMHRVLADGPDGCRLVALRGTPAADLMFPPRAFRPEGRAYTSDCAPRDNVALSLADAQGLQSSAMMIAEGVPLVQRHLRPGQSVLPLTFGNPFTLILGARPPRGVAIWWDGGRTYSATLYPPGEPIFADTDWVMEPLVKPRSLTDNWGDMNTDRMLAIYGGLIRRDFVVVDQTPTWRLWGRRATNAPAQANQASAAPPLALK